jgi:hypothetical protein
MGFRVLGTNHTSFTVSSLDRSVGFFRDCLKFKLVSRAPRDPAPVPINAGPNKGRKVAYLRDWDGVTFEFIEAAAK